jgi:ATP/maltotriose-dependent transcriptional regulator MalT
LARKLTLISAPAGYGKAILLTEWIPQSERCVCWISLNEADNWNAGLKGRCVPCLGLAASGA